MWNAILKWLLDNYPIVAIVVVLIALAVYITIVIIRYKNKIDNTEEKVLNLPCESHGKDIREHSSMKNTLNSINEKVTDISRWIMHFDNTMIDTLSKKCSPRVMTEIGRELFNISGAKEAIDTNLESLINKVEEKSPKTPFDVEVYSQDVLMDNLSDPMFNAIKNYVYYQPEEIELKDSNGITTKVKISLMTIVKLMSLELRDKYLNKHTDIR